MPARRALKIHVKYRADLGQYHWVSLIINNVLQSAHFSKNIFEACGPHLKATPAPKEPFRFVILFTSLSSIIPFDVYLQ